MCPWKKWSHPILLCEWKALVSCGMIGSSGGVQDGGGTSGSVELTGHAVANQRCHNVRGVLLSEVLAEGKESFGVGDMARLAWTLQNVVGVLPKLLAFKAASIDSIVHCL